MSTTDWRDDPSIIWQDEDGDQLRVRPDGYLWSAVVVAIRPADVPELVARLVAAFGHRLTGGVVPVPKPIVAGDRVRVRFDGGWVATVIAVDGDQAWVRRFTGHRSVVPLGSLTRIEDEPTEPEDGAR